MLGTPLAENVVALSVEMAPLRTADATAALSMTKFPKDLPDRAERITAHMQEALPGCLYGSEHLMAKLLDRLSSSAPLHEDLVCKSVAFGSEDKTVVLVPAIKECVACAADNIRRLTRQDRHPCPVPACPREVLYTAI